MALTSSAGGGGGGGGEPKSSDSLPGGGSGGGKPKSSNYQASGGGGGSSGGDDAPESSDQLPGGGEGGSGGGGGGEPKSSDQIPRGGGEGSSSGGGATGSVAPPSLSESQKRRQLNTFEQYLSEIHKPPLSLETCSGEHVIEFLKYLDQYGKTKVHLNGCTYYGHLNPPAPCACPFKQAWGSLDTLIGRLRDAYEEIGGRPESNPFGTRAVKIYLREIREWQAKSRGIPYMMKKKRKKSTYTTTKTTSTPTTMLPNAINVPSGDAGDLQGKLVSMSLKMSDPGSQEQENVDEQFEKSPRSPRISMSSEIDGLVCQRQEGGNKSRNDKSPASYRVSEGDNVQTVSIEEESGTWELVTLSKEMSGPAIQEQEGSDNSGLHRIRQSPMLEHTPEHKIILELLFKCGLLCPTLWQMEQIIKQLSEYGKIEGIDVYQWFQARQVQERQEHTSSSLIATSTERLKPNTGGMDMDGVSLLAEEKDEVANRIEELLLDPEKLSTYTRWRPTPDQKSILELLYNCGMLSPTMQQILQISEQLSECGEIKDIDVYRWFPARQAEEGQEQTSSSVIPRIGEGLRIEETSRSTRTSEQDKGKAVSVEEKNGIGEVVSMSSKLSSPLGQEQQGSDGSMQTENSPTSPRVSERGTAVSAEEKSGTGKLVSMSKEMSGPANREQEGSANSRQSEKSPAPPRISEQGDNVQTVSVEEETGTWELVTMSKEMSGPASQEQEGSDNSGYDNTGKLLPIKFEKQRELIPTVQENIIVMANTIYIARVYPEESNPDIPSLPTVSPSRSLIQGSPTEGQDNPEIEAPSANSTEGEEVQPESQENQETVSPPASSSQPEGQVKTEIADPKKHWRLKLFPWWHKK